MLSHAYAADAKAYAETYAELEATETSKAQRQLSFAHAYGR